MILSWLLASVHLIALAIGFASCWMRANALQKVRSNEHLKPVFFADNLYGIATLLWIVTGLWRAFGGQAKGSDYYLNSDLFWLKMGVFGLIFAIELYPMVMLIRWRKQLKSGKEIDLQPSRQIARMSYLELICFAIMVFVATAMARGI